MRTFTTVLFLTFACYTKQQTTMDPAFVASVQADQAACAQENSVQISDAVKIWTNPDFPANNGALKCYYKCICLKLKIIVNGKYDSADTMAFFAHYDNGTDIKEIGDQCKEVLGSDECEFAYQLFKCVANIELNR